MSATYKGIKNVVSTVAAKGTLNAAGGAVGDTYGDMVGGDSMINKIAETAGKLGEVGFEKNVTGKVGDIIHGKDK